VFAQIGPPGDGTNSFPVTFMLCQARRGANARASNIKEDAMADENVDNLRSEVNQLRSDLRSLSDSVKNLASERGERAYESVREGAAAARKRAESAEKALEHQVEERPLTSILISFVGGLLAGLLIQSRR
jgi:ElaB/YqjD/DUF883 family membrane-anchored ribosome-binding protein